MRKLTVYVQDSMMTAAIVLAAGKSERMGQNKLLLRLNDDPLLGTVLKAITTADIHEKVLVLGYKAQEVIDVVAPREDVQIVINPDYEQGMASSFKKGLRLVRHVDAAFLVLGDQPILDESLLVEMVRQLVDHPDVLIVSPAYEGKKGHPALFRKKLFDELLSLDEAETARDVIHRHLNKLNTVEAPEWTILDVDTPEDYARIRALMKGRDNP